ncbi:MAG TPA: glutamine--fructose-6-phosphate aminotransferase, partial [Cyanobacteria bacterium UBA8156]|nr:glutamine--fructose-6-phosphate aminotransferase [Cyanobacteria bacterium UBA8156]
MCGIVGYIGDRRATSVLISGLEKLEYRGYDSAGVALVSAGTLHRIRAKGKLIHLKEKLAQQGEQPAPQQPATMGVGHTRWATHGKPE